MSAGDIKTIQIETMLLGWKRSHNGGSEIRLLLQDDDDLAHFEQMTVRKGKIAGQRLMAVFVDLKDNETPVTIGQAEAELKKPAEKEPIGPLCKLAVQWCKDPEFAHWWLNTYPEAWEASSRDARQLILDVCGIKSRRELDTNHEAARRFDVTFRIPFAEHLKEIAHG